MVGIYHWRDVHLFNFTHSAKMVEHLIVVHSALGFLVLARDILLLEELVGVEEISHVLLRQGVYGFEGTKRGRKPVPQKLRHLAPTAGNRGNGHHHRDQKPRTQHSRFPRAKADAEDWGGGSA